MRCELHCHSTASDGTRAPDDVVALAAARGVTVFALSDHDACTRVDAPAGMRVIRAVEMSCDHAGRTIHVLAYDRGSAPNAWTALEHELVATREARRNRLRVMAARLAQRGVRVDVEPLIAAAHERSVGRPDLARAMVAQGAASSLKDAFARHLYDGGPVDVPCKSLSLEAALALGRAANAAMSLAHPHLYDHVGEAMLRRYRGDGLAGVEAFYGAYDARERARWIELAGALDLVCTGGSDWHGPESATQLGVDLPDARADALLAWLTSS